MGPLRSILAVCVVILASTATSEPIPKKKHTIDRRTVCGGAGPDKTITLPILQKNVETYRREFGGGHGVLHPGWAGAPTMQAVCCQGWCLWVEKEYDLHTYEWDNALFEDAVSRIAGEGIGKGGCEQFMRDRDLRLMFYPEEKQVWAREGSHRPKELRAIEWFGDTCGGARGWNGPHTGE